jgi:para-nitrobenzyl esterase
MKSILLGAGLALVLTGVAMAQPPAQTIKIDSGQIHGAVADGVLSFKGIPFAAPPVGSLRWRPPQPVAAWTGVREATAYGHDCMQEPFPSDAAPLGVKPAEDCLVLNVWRPAARSGTLPVMVWLYGGGFVNGGSSPDVYSGAALAKQGVVVVSINYRVGRFGFFAFPALSAANPSDTLGNYAYMDQIAGLQWVQRNIAAFGGDPANVTLFGESAGGMSVHALMASPMAKGLFAKAIVESGAGRSGRMPSKTLKEAEQVGVDFAQSVGVQGRDAAALAALRALPAETITGGMNMAHVKDFTGPIVDGRILPEQTEAAYRAGRTPLVPMMIGVNSMDGFFSGKTLTDAYAPFKTPRLAAAAPAVFDPKSGGDAKAVGSRVSRDVNMAEPARLIARLLSDRGDKVYGYRFGYVADSMRPEWTLGAPHASEIPFVFDTVKARYGASLTARDEAVAQLTSAYWVAFAKTGDPNGGGRPFWPAFTTAGDKLLLIGDAVHAEADPLKAELDLVKAQVDGS